MRPLDDIHQHIWKTTRIRNGTVNGSEGSMKESAAESIDIEYKLVTSSFSVFSKYSREYERATVVAIVSNLHVTRRRQEEHVWRERRSGGEQAQWRCQHLESMQLRGRVPRPDCSPQAQCHGLISWWSIMTLLNRSANGPCSDFRGCFESHACMQ